MNKKRPKVTERKPAEPSHADASASDSASPVEPERQEFPVVGIGASAGGLEAMSELLQQLPVDTGMAFVLVQHLDPEHKSNLAEILSRTTQMPVAEIGDGSRLEPNHVFVMPADKDVAILHGVLHLMSRPTHPAQHMPIDYFFRALAEDHGSRAIAVVLSGTGSDGSLGLRAVKAEGGITFAQDPQTARHSGMPSAAIATGDVDFVLSPRQIAAELVRIGHHPSLTRAAILAADETPTEPVEPLQKIFLALRRATGVDFTYYKQSTVERRIRRRMLLHRIDAIKDYLRYLQQTPAEVGVLFEDMLITVTSFFRDPDTFEVLKRRVFPELLKDRSVDQPIRIWVPGCSTGEEAYSIAIALAECLNDRDHQCPIQLFATDVSNTAIERARAGRYPENIAADVSPERLRRFFIKSGTGYQVSKTIRDLCIFARQNVTKDPPFSTLDLLSCRNLLIYMGPVFQKRIIPAFHYALKPNGFLLLGSSETIGGFSDLFHLVDRKHKIYTKKAAAARLPLDLSMTAAAPLVEPKGKEPPAVRSSGFDVRREADRVVLANYAPCGVVVDENLDIVQFRGQTGRFLEPAPGDASLNVLKMARTGLALDLRAAIHKAKNDHAPVRREGIQVAYNGRGLLANVEVIPLGPASASETYFLVLFEEAASPPAVEAPQATGTSSSQERDREIAQLREELGITKETLQSIIEEHEATNEELRAANEEIQSSNEELQSTNEELETAKEELQSTNEELTTLNEELENRNAELSQAVNDLNNLLNNVDIPILILGGDLRIRSLTPVAERVLGLIPADVGRSIRELKLSVAIPDLEHKVVTVVETLATHQEELQTADARWYSLRIRPYRTTDNRIDGAVLVLVDITERKHAEAETVAQELTHNARVLAQSMVATVRQPLVVLDQDLRVAAANPAFYRMFQLTSDEAEGRLLVDLDHGQWDLPELGTLLEGARSQERHPAEVRVEHDFPRIGRRIVRLSARRIDRPDGHPQLLLLAIEDITDE